MALGSVGLVAIPFYNWFIPPATLELKTLVKKSVILGELVDLIIPETDTPGAKAAGVHEYIIRVLHNCCSAREIHNFYNGIVDLENYSLQKYDTLFLHCDFDTKCLILRHYENKALYPYKILNKINNKINGTPFFVKLKQLTTEGYCMSQIGATQALAYDYIPQHFEACIPLQVHQRSWATK